MSSLFKGGAGFYEGYHLEAAFCNTGPFTSRVLIGQRSEEIYKKERRMNGMKVLYGSVHKVISCIHIAELGTSYFFPGSQIAKSLI